MSENVLTSRQRRALVALLTHKSIGEAARACKLSEKSLQRYLQNPDFRAALTELETATIDEAGRRLLSGQTLALDTLEDLMKDALKESDQRLSAAAWLDFALRWRELRNVELRLADLEEAVYGSKPG